jgi:hypothetical protein
MATSLKKYEVGSTLSLTRLSPQTGLPTRKIRVRIQELKTRSCSATMVVTIASSNEPKSAFLKLYDWRYADTARAHRALGPWNPTTEFAFIRSLTQARHSIYDNQEAALAEKLRDSYFNEAAVYGALRAHQGATVPRLIAAVDLDLTPAGAEDHELFHVKGLLLEEIVDGFSLAKIPGRVPRDAWQGVVDAAVDAGRLLGECGVLDPDRHAGNFVVVRGEEGGFRVVMIDFGRCRFRKKGESERMWREKLARNEVVGEWMRGMLATRHKFELLCWPLEKYLG